MRSSCANLYSRVEYRPLRRYMRQRYRVRERYRVASERPSTSDRRKVQRALREGSSSLDYGKVQRVPRERLNFELRNDAACTAFNVPGGKDSGNAWCSARDSRRKVIEESSAVKRASNFGSEDAVHGSRFNSSVNVVAGSSKFSVFRHGRT